MHVGFAAQVSLTTTARNSSNSQAVGCRDAQLRLRFTRKLDTNLVVKLRARTAPHQA